MWPPDPDPDPDPDPAGSSPPGAPVPGLRALLPARAFLCSLKGRLLLAESVSAAWRDPHRPAPWAAPLARRVPLSRCAWPTPLGALPSWANLPTLRTDSLKFSAWVRDGAEPEPGPSRVFYPRVQSWGP